MQGSQNEFINVAGTQIAFRRQSGRAPGVVWLGGFKSDMTGTKAETLATWAASNDRAFLRHDYSGHGASGGAFRDGTISAWLIQSLAVFRAFGPERAVLVGSSMGAWIALRMAQELANVNIKPVAGLVLIAPAPDFTMELMEPSLTKKQKADLAGKGFFEEASEYGPEPNIYTRTLFEDGYTNRVMSGPIDTHCPVHIIQGLADPDVPHTHALKLASLLPADDLTMTLVPGGDHRLSRPEDLELIVRAIDSVISFAG